MNQRRMTKAEWSKKPYAGSRAGRTEDSVTTLLRKYGVACFQWTQGRGPNARPAIMFRFELKEKSYRIMIETLWADASADELMIQAKRAIYYYLKSALEMASVFVPMEKAFFAFLELPDGTTCFEAAQPHIAQLKSPDFSRLMLPSPSQQVVINEVTE